MDKKTPQLRKLRCVHVGCGDVMGKHYEANPEDRNAISKDISAQLSVENLNADSSKSLSPRDTGVPVSKREYAQLMEKIGFYQKGDVYARTKRGELIIPQDGNFYYYGGSYLNPYINRVIYINVKEDNDYEATKHGAVQEALSFYEEQELQTLQGRSIEDVLRLISNVARSVIGTGVDFDRFDSGNVKRFYRLKPTRSNQNGSDDYSPLGKTLIQRIDHTASGEELQGDPKDGGRLKYSLRNQQYMDLAEDPDKNERELQRMVDDEALEAIPHIAKDGNGRPFRLYHGTRRFGFTQFEDSIHDVPFIYISTNSTVYWWHVLAPHHKSCYLYFS